MTPTPRRVTVLQHSHDVVLDRFGPWLADAGVDVTLVRADLGEPVPSDLADVGDGLVVLGGHMSAISDDVAPWLPATRDLLAQAASSERAVPVLGICLGAQLLAVACGGRLQVAAPPGRESGVVDVRWRPEAQTDPVVGALAAVSTTSPFPTMHADAVVDLPRGATWLGATPMYPFQVFRVGSAWGVQFHPEAGDVTLRRWADGYADVDAEAVMAQHARRAAEVEAAGRALCDGFASVVLARVEDGAPVSR